MRVCLDQSFGAESSDDCPRAVKLCVSREVSIRAGISIRKGGPRQMHGRGAHIACVGSQAQDAALYAHRPRPEIRVSEMTIDASDVQWHNLVIRQDRRNVPLIAI